MDLYRITEQKLHYFRYSKNTIKTYLNYIHEFEKRIGKHYSRLNAKDIQSYLDSYIFSSTSKQNQVVSALKFAWEKGLGRKYLKIDFKRPRKEKKLPRVIDKDFLIKKIEAIKNLKHRAIIQLAFSTGMRVSEVINLKVEDIDSERMLIRVNNAKGRKDRVVPLSIGTLEVLREYYKSYKPFEYMFEGQFGGKYSSTSCNKLVKKYIGKEYHFHLLRHSAFTSMLESGTDLRVIQSIAGHVSSKTTEIYTHVSKTLLNKVATPM